MDGQVGIDVERHTDHFAPTVEQRPAARARGDAVIRVIHISPVATDHFPFDARPMAAWITE